MSSRRNNRRLETPTRLRCTLKDLPVQFIRRDISAGGFSIVTDLGLHEGDIHVVTLTLDDVSVVTFARVVHCRVEGRHHWIVGLKFLDRPRKGTTVAELLERISPS